MTFEDFMDQIDENTKSLNQLIKQYEAVQNVFNSIETKSFDLVRDYDELSGVWNEEERALLDLWNLKKLFYDEGWVFIVVDLIAMKISAQPLKIYRKTIDQNGQVNIEEAPKHPLQQILSNPNKYQGYHTYMYSVAVDHTLIGNSITWKGALGNSLYHIPAQTMQLEFDKEQNVTSYLRYNFDPLNTLKILTGKYQYSEIIHTKRPNPDSMFWGLSPFMPGRKFVLFNRFTAEYLNNYYLKGATSGLALEMTKDANEKSALRLLRSFESAYTGRKNQRRTLVLPQGVSAKQVAASLADQQLKDYLTMNKEDILALLKVPKHEVGLQTAGSLGSEEYKTALKNFWATTIIPTQVLIADEFNRSYKSILGEEFFIQFDNTSVEILKENEIEKSNIAQGLLKTHTINEVRQKLYQLEPLDGGDSLPGATQINQPFFGLSAEVPEKKEYDPEKTNDVELNLIKETSADRLIKAYGDWFQSRKDKINQAIKEPQKDLTKIAVKMFSDQSVAVIKKLDKIIEKAKPKKANDESKTESIIKELLAKEVNKYLSDWSKQYKDIGEGISVAGYMINVDNNPIRLDEYNPELSDKIKNDLKKQLEERARKTFQYMTEKTTNDVYKLIKNGIDESKTTQQIASDISQVYSNPDKIMYRADRIARTETLGALSIGQNKSMKEASDVIKDLKKMWVSTEDLRTRGNPGGLYPDSDADHWGLHGQVVNHNDKFQDPRNGELLEYPRDPNGSAGSVINCRCTWIILPAKEMEKFTRTEQGAQPNE
jgi:HK97 family phage portal protein